MAWHVDHDGSGANCPAVGAIQSCLGFQVCAVERQPGRPGLAFDRVWSAPLASKALLSGSLSHDHTPQ